MKNKNEIEQTKDAETMKKHKVSSKKVMGQMKLAIFT